jgi:hypothetical protein
MAFKMLSGAACWSLLSDVGVAQGEWGFAEGADAHEGAEADLAMRIGAAAVFVKTLRLGVHGAQHMSGAAESLGLSFLQSFIIVWLHTETTQFG